ncbi:MAG: NUDIX hydrolase [Lachnospiraceae bacterium]|nr:NUDIX hydrolase [Lachnospiraceae bacterium]
MEFLKLEKVYNGRYLKNYELTYLNKAGKEKKFELVSRKEITCKEELGLRPSGVSIVAYQDDRLLLLKEFRMSINKSIYNLCAGMLEKGESLEDCIRRELYEETGLGVKQIISILPPSFAAVGFSDTTTYAAFVEVEGEIEDHSSVNEDIHAGLYTKEEVKELMEKEEFSSRSQIAAYFFVQGFKPTEEK